jgi:hypothetical protein
LLVAAADDDSLRLAETINRFAEAQVLRRNGEVHAAPGPALLEAASESYRDLRGRQNHRSRPKMAGKCIDVPAYRLDIGHVVFVDGSVESNPNDVGRGAGGRGVAAEAQAARLHVCLNQFGEARLV